MRDKIQNEIYMFFWSIVCFIFFWLLFLNGYIIKYDNVLIWVFQELFTLPFLWLVFWLYFFSIKSNIKYKFSYKTYSFWTAVILNIILIAMILSFV